MFISLFSVGVGARGFCFPVGWAPLGGGCPKVLLVIYTPCRQVGLLQALRNTPAMLVCADPHNVGRVSWVVRFQR